LGLILQRLALQIAHGLLTQSRKVFFSEEKKQKTFVSLGARQPGHVRQGTKVFWFFFSKKNVLRFMGRRQ
jgi:hypothetical protein